MSTAFIALSGTNGSGKDSVGKILADDYGYMFISVTDLLRDELARRGLPPERQHMRELSAEWRRESGLGVLVDKAMETYKASPKQHKGLVIASLRNPGEVIRTHELDGIVAWIDADARLRYDRLQANAASRGAHRAVDDQKSFEEFLAEEAIEMHKPENGDEANLNMSGVKEGADVFIENNGTDFAAFKAQIAEAFGL